MIFSVNTFWDTAFVSRTMSELGLDPMPVAGFATDGHYNVLTPAWRRVIESYPWGCVAFLSNRRADLHATMICVGRVDWVDGLVTDGDRADRLWDHVPWIEDMIGAMTGVPMAGPPPAVFEAGEEIWDQEREGAANLPDIVNSSTVLDSPRPIAQVSDGGLAVPPAGHSASEPTARSAGIPPCVGYHIPCTTCDGGLQSNGEIESVCTWRNRCKGLFDYCRIHRCAPDDVRVALSEVDFQHVTSQYEALYGPYPLDHPPPVAVSPETASVRHGDDDIPEPNAEERPPLSAKAEKTALLRQETEQKAKAFWEALLLRMGMDFAVNPEHPKLGEVYLRVVRSGSGSWTGYRVMPDGPVGFIRLWMKPNRGGFHVHLPVPLEHPAVVEFKQAVGPVKSWKHSRFMTLVPDVCNELPVEEVIELIVAVSPDLGIGVELVEEGE